jgi:hypothetical protein
MAIELLEKQQTTSNGISGSQELDSHNGRTQGASNGGRRIRRGRGRGSRYQHGENKKKKPPMLQQKRQAWLVEAAAAASNANFF